MNRNKINGNRFEREFSELLAAHGWWAHVFQQNRDGQPADIIAARAGFTTLIDCKLLEKQAPFPLSRIEANQWLAMERFETLNQTPCFFSIKLWTGEIRMVKFSTIRAASMSGKSALTYSDLMLYSHSIQHWLGVYSR
jgi:Holliday junction resolvase